MLVPPALRPGAARLNPGFPERKNRKGGAPLGNRNRFVHGRYSGETLALNAAVRAHIQAGKALIALAQLFTPRRRHIVETLTWHPGEAEPRRTVREFVTGGEGPSPALCRILLETLAPGRLSTRPHQEEPSPWPVIPSSRTSCTARGAR